MYYTPPQLSLINLNDSNYLYVLTSGVANNVDPDPDLHCFQNKIYLGFNMVRV